MTATLHHPPPMAPDQGPAPTSPPSGQQAFARAYTAPTLVAAVAMIAGALSLTAIIDGTSWLMPLIGVVAVTWLLGLACRLLAAPAPLTVVVQFLGLAGTLTGIYTSSGWAGFIPTPTSVGEAGALLSGAWGQILGTVPPAPSTVELSFLVCLTVGTTALIADFLVAEAQSPALIALPLLCLYSVPASIAVDQLQWWTFVAPAVCYATLLAITGHRGMPTKGRANVTVALTAIVVAAASSLIAVVASDSVTSVSTEGRLPREGTGGSGDIGISPFTSLRGNLNRDNPQDLLTVSGLPQGDYLRVIGLEDWTPGEQGGFTYADLAGESFSDGVLPGRTPQGDLELEVTSQQWASEFLPIYAGTNSVDGLTGGWLWDPNLGSLHRNRSINPEQYTLRASFDRPAADDLRADSVVTRADLLSTGTIPQSVVTLAQDLTSDADTAFDKADALLRFFTDGSNGFTYSLDVPRGTTGDPLSDFLQMRQGFCEQYATTMAVMLRALDIPARVAVGFTQGTNIGSNTWQITTNDAHAWVEVLFAGHGWVRFDPTPLGGNAGSQQGFSEGGAGQGEGTSTTTTSTATSSSASAASSTSNSAADPAGAAQLPDDGGTQANSASSTDVAAGGGGIPSQVWWLLLGGCVVAGLGVLPTVIRRGRRRGRLRAAASGGPGAASAAWAEVEGLLVDHGLPLGTSESSRAVANRLARTSRLTDRTRQDLRVLVLAAEQEWYSDPAQATAAADKGGELVKAVEGITTSLRQTSPLTWLDRWVPRSVRPLQR